MIFGSVIVYALGRELGPHDADLEFRRQVAEPDGESLAGARTMHRLNTLDAVGLAVDAGGTAIGQTRSRILHAFYSIRDADVWVSCDDDVDASVDTLRWLVAAVRETKGVCVAPCLVRRRDRQVVNVMFDSLGVIRPLPDGGQAVRCVAAGFGLVAMHREVAERIYLEKTDLAFIDEDGQEKRAAFHDWLDPEKRRWWGEDLSFFLRGLPEGTRVECLVTGHTVHAGQFLDLSKVPEQAAAALRHTQKPDVECVACHTKQPYPAGDPPVCVVCGGPV